MLGRIAGESDAIGDLGRLQPLTGHEPGGHQALLPRVRGIDQIRLQLFILAFELSGLPRRLFLPRPIKTLSMMTLREKLIKIGAKAVHHGSYVFFQMAEAAGPRE